MHIEDCSEHTEDKADCQRTGVAHEDFLVFVDIAEHIIIEEGDEHAECAEADYGKSIFAEEHECDTIDDTYDRAETRCESVDSVDEIDGIDEEHENHDCEG